MMRIDESVLTVISGVSVDGAVVKLPNYQLERSLYLKVNQVLEAIGGKWNRKLKGHLFSEDPTDKIEDLILTGEYDKPSNFGYFPTPQGLAERVVLLAGIELKMLVLEPSAGRGSIALEAARIVGKENVHCFELLPDNSEFLGSQGFPVKCCDFLDVDPIPIFDRVVMNPPFAKQQDIEHVTHALKFLKPGGRLVSIMASGVTFRENRRTTDFLSLIDGRSRIISNPEGSFKLSNTMVNTVTLIADQEG